MSRKAGRIVKIAVLLLLLGCIPVAAASGQEGSAPLSGDLSKQLDLSAGLSEEALGQLESIGLDPNDPESLTKLDSAGFLNLLWQSLQSCLVTPFSVFLSLLLLILLCSVTQSSFLPQSPFSDTYSCLSAMVVCAVLVVPLSQSIYRVCAALEAVGVFLNVFVPAYCGILILCGRVLTAAKYQSTVLVLSHAITTLTYRVFSPLCGMMIAVSVASGVSRVVDGRKLAAGIGKAVKWCLGFCMMLFSGTLALHTAASGAADSLSQRTQKFLIGSSVPVIGSSISDAYTAVRSSFGLLRTGAGLYGIIAVLVILLPVFTEITLYRLTLFLSGIIADLFGLDDLSATFSAINSTASILISLMVTIFLTFVISLSTVVTLGGSL